MIEMTTPTAAAIAAAIDAQRDALRGLEQELAAATAAADQAESAASAGLADSALGVTVDATGQADAVVAAAARVAELGARVRTTRGAIADLERRHAAALAREDDIDQEALAAEYAAAHARLMAAVADLEAAGREAWALIQRDDAIAGRRARRAGVPSREARRLRLENEAGPIPIPELERIARYAAGTALTLAPARAPISDPTEDTHDA